MPSSKFERFLPYSGVLAGILFAAAAYVPKLSQEYGDPDAAAMLVDNEVRTMLGVLAGTLFCTVMLFFAAALRRALRSGESDESTYSGVAYAGAILVALSQAVVAWIILSAYDAADQGDKDVVNTLAYLGIDNWILWVAPSAAMFLAVGFGGLRNAVLPKWLAVASLILGVGCILGPVGIAVYIVTPLWLVTTGIVLGQRQEVSAPRERVLV